jgi:hypothetical protein
MRYVFVCFFALLLYGCATPEQRAAQQAAQQQADAERSRQQEAAYNRQLRNQCESIGYQPNTDPWRQCLLQLHTANQQRDAQMRGIILQQMLQEQQQQNYRSMPYCSSLPPGARGYAQAQGNCK